MVMLVSAAFLYYIVSTVTITDLETEQETGIAGIFQKEGLRLFVDDCIEDSLEEGLIKIGEGGRLWYESSEIEGTLTFSENINGINYGGGQYYLGLTHSPDEEFPENYPCDGFLEDTPYFCQYLYPDAADFGYKESLTLTNIESDLQKYVENATLDCVQEFLSSELSYSGDLGEGELDLEIEIESDGINIDMEYPLELIVEGETYFHLTEFTFFYISNFKTFFQKAVTTPLGNEQRDVDYNWTDEELQSSSSYVALSPTLTVQEVGENTEGLGHKIITYELDAGHILENKPYSFSFAIQNRPPALDYISREACTDYDYVAIAGYESELGSINITAEAHDPDQDIITYTFNEDEGLGALLSFSQIDDAEKQLANITADIPEDFSPAGIHSIIINSTDAHGEDDWQEVRVLIDRPLVMEVAVENPYGLVDSSVANYSSSTPLLSTEDPFFVKVITPEESASSDVTQSALIKYTDDDNEGDFEYSLPTDTSEEHCFSFPWSGTHTDCVTDYTDDELEEWKDILEITPLYSHMSYSGAEGTTGVNGYFELEFTANYCSTFNQEESVTQDVFVAECIPVRNSTHPFAYPYHEVTVEDGSSPYVYLEDEEINPFYSTHSCCESFTNTYYSEETECYTSPIDCHGAIEGWTTIKPNLVLEQKKDFCSGERGNICGALKGDESTMVSELKDGKLICGTPSQYDSCSNDIHQSCEGEEAWSHVGVGKTTWCHGDMGCTEVCSGYPVYTGPITNFEDYMSTRTVNSFAIEKDATKDDSGGEFEFACGCDASGVETNDPCDYYLDNSFSGVCMQGSCYLN